MSDNRSTADMSVIFGDGIVKSLMLIDNYAKIYSIDSIPLEENFSISVKIRDLEYQLTKTRGFPVYHLNYLDHPLEFPITFYLLINGMLFLIESEYFHVGLKSIDLVLIDQFIFEFTDGIKVAKIDNYFVIADHSYIDYQINHEKNHKNQNDVHRYGKIMTIKENWVLLPTDSFKKIQENWVSLPTDSFKKIQELLETKQLERHIIDKLGHLIKF